MSSAVPIRRGDDVELAIEALGDGPDALARVGNYVVFVPGALPGERVRAHITSAGRKFGRAEVRAVLQAAPGRIAPACRHFLDCGGCHWQHIDYAAQLLHKQARLQKELAHHCGADAPPVLAALPAAAPYGQRHKVALQLLPGAEGSLAAGLHSLRSPALVELAECPASAPAAFALAQAAVAVLRDLGVPAFDPVRGRGLCRAVLVRKALGTDEALVVLVAARRPRQPLRELAARLVAAGATTVALNHNDGPPSLLLGRRTEVLAGPARIREQLAGETYCISPQAFFQTAPAAAAVLVQLVLHWLLPRRSDTVFDLYCGGGLFSLPLARSAGTVVGIEESPVAIGDAEAAARLAGRDNLRFCRGIAGHLLLDVRRGRLPRPDLVVLDPPRAGAGADALQTLAALEPRRIAYVACEPAALARDLAVLHQDGYRTRAVVPVDMFPQTAHIEAVAMLQHRRTGRAPVRLRLQDAEADADVLPAALRG